MARGEEVSVLQIAGELDMQTDWIKSSVSTEMKDVIVTLQSGNIFQVYYSGIYGATYIEYIGRDDGNPVPTISAKYDEAGNSIKVTVSISSGSIKTVEMSYRGNVQEKKEANETEGEMTFELKEKGNGWYVLRATSDKEKQRYAWVKLALETEGGTGEESGNETGKLPVPTITVTPSEAPVGDYYKSEVTVTITANLGEGQTIKYSTVIGASTNADTENGTTYLAPFKVSEEGITIVYAWVTDGKTNGVPAKRIIKIDPNAGTTTPEVPETLTAPTIIAEAKNEADKGNRGWTKGPVTINIQDSKNNTANKELYYEITNLRTNEKTSEGPITGSAKTFDYTKNGEYRIRAWYTKEAGGEKGPSEETNFKIDTDKPSVANIAISNANSGPATDVIGKEYYYNTKATVIVEPRMDATSGIYGVRIETVGANEIAVDDYEVSTSKEIEITKEGTSTIRAWTIDNAGNISGEVTELAINLDNTAPSAPNLTVATAHSAYSTDEDPWYNNEAVQIDIAKGQEEDIYQIIYGTKQKDSEEEPTLRRLAGETETLYITDEGKIQVIAYAVDKAGNKSEAETKNVQIDRTKPTVASLDCQPGDGAILMTASGAEDNENGAGLAEYMFFVDNKAGSEDTIVRNEVGDETKPEPNKATFTTSMGRYLGQVAVVDKAGNISAVQGNSDARTKMYKYTSVQTSRWFWWDLCHGSTEDR